MSSHIIRGAVSAALFSASALVAAPVLAADVTGAALDFSHFNYAEGGARDIGRTALGGQMVIEFAPQFAIQGDATLMHFRDLDWNASSWSLHGIYDMGLSRFGAFAGYDNVDSDDTTYLGLEYLTDIYGTEIEAAFTSYDSDNMNDGAIYNIAARMPLGTAFTVGARADFLDRDGAPNSRRVGATASYDVQGGYALNGELGLMDTNGDDAEVYVGLGVTANFDSGAAFSRRGLTELLPGL